MSESSPAPASDGDDSPVLDPLDAGAAEEPRWLSPQERAAWLSLVGVMVKLPAALDAQLQRDAGLSYFEYMVLAMLSAQPDRTLRMSELAAWLFTDVTDMTAERFKQRPRENRSAAVIRIEQHAEGMRANLLHIDEREQLFQMRLAERGMRL